MQENIKIDQNIQQNNRKLSAFHQTYFKMLINCITGNYVQQHCKIRKCYNGKLGQIFWASKYLE